jgi:CubicO group peptidase (beta-lactamase class C family)
MRELVQTGVSGVVVRLQRGGRVRVLTAGSVRAFQHFRIASETKTFTAATVLKLVAAKRLSLTDSVQRWLPGLVPNGARIMTPLRNSHFSWSARALIRISTALKPEFPPGTVGATRTRTTSSSSSSS